MQKLFLRLLACLPLFVCIATRAQTENFKDSVETYYGNGQYRKAYFFAEKQADKMKALNDTAAYAAAVSDLGALNQAFGNVSKADSLFRIAEELQKINPGERSQEYAITLMNIGSLQNQLGNYIEAEPFEKKAVEIFQALGKDSYEYMIAVNNIGLLYQNMERFDQSKNYYAKALLLLDTLGGKNNAGYTEILNNIGILNYQTGNYKEAENKFLEALEIKRKDSIPNLPTIALYLSNLATFYTNIGNGNAAEPLILESLKIRKQTMDDDPVNYAISLNNWANILMEQKNYHRADSVYRIVETLLRKALPATSPYYMRSVTNLALSTSRLGNFGEAEKLLGNIMDTCKKHANDTTAQYADAQGQLGREYYYVQNYTRAEPLLLQAAATFKNIEGAQHPDYIETLLALGDLLLSTNRYKETETYVPVVYDAEKNFLLDRLTFLSEPELLLYLQKQNTAFELPCKLLWKYPASGMAAQYAYNTCLLLKGVAIENTNSLTNLFGKLEDVKLSGLLASYKQNKELLSKTLSSKSINGNASNTDSLIRITNRQEKELLTLSADYRNMTGKMHATWQDVRAKLLPGAAAIEFVAFRQQKMTGNEDGKTCYAALLLRPQDSLPVYIPLFTEEKLKIALQSFLYKSVGAATLVRQPENHNAGNSDIYKLLWQPLEPYLAHIKTIYFSPDGLLHQVAFSAIPYGNSQLLADRYNLVQLTSTRLVAMQNSTTAIPASIALFGGIDYEQQQADSAMVMAAPVYYTYHKNNRSSTSVFNYLPNTLTEITDIQKATAGRNMKATCFTGSRASESAYRHLGDTLSPGIIHFATHGFAFAAPSLHSTVRNNFSGSGNPLVRTGLVMAGGHKGWINKNKPDEDDGILSALEIAAIPLPNTRLAVLSACKTATGDIRGNEGVFGLQRAFKLAGVQYIIASLWPVPDVQTKELMNDFYTRLMADNNIRHAFTQAQQDMRKKYNPYYWAAFTLVQ